MHLCQDLLWESLGDLVEVDGAAGFFDALRLSLREGLDMTPCGVLVECVSDKVYYELDWQAIGVGTYKDDSDLWCHCC